MAVKNGGRIRTQSVKSAVIILSLREKESSLRREYATWSWMKESREWEEFFGIGFDRRVSDWDVDWWKTEGGRRSDSIMNGEE